MFLHRTRLVLCILITSLMLTLTACGGGDDESGTIPMPDPEIEQSTPEPESDPELEPEPEPEPEARLPFPFGFQPRPGFRSVGCTGCIGFFDAIAQTAADAQQAPVYHDANIGGLQAIRERLFVGIDQGTEHIGRLPLVGKRDGFDVRYGHLDDGAGASAVRTYLHDASSAERQPSPFDKVIRRHTTPPLVRFGGEVTAEDVNRLVRAVQLVNMALPPEGKMQMPSSTSTSNPRSGIYVEFIPEAEFPDPPVGQAIGGLTIVHSEGSEISYSEILIKNFSRTYHGRVETLAHELIHALGIAGDLFNGHVSPDFDSLMETPGGGYNNQLRKPQSLLYPVDREALRVLYGRLEPGDSPTDLGPWSATSAHLHANGQHAAFGVAMRNGYTEPWAHGYLPAMDLADNATLSGSATWDGLLLGFTPGAAPVAGDARLGINLGTMTGRANFTSLESWAAGAAPGEAGTGEVWGDGDLGYSISVLGNTFKQTGGDDGILTGAFFGESHEGMGGTLEREDLTAAFGGTR